MAAPSHVTMDDQTAVWVLDRPLSTDADTILALQGVNWIVRKAVGLATITMVIKQSAGVSPTTSAPIVQLEISQGTSSGIGGTQTTRYLDWNEYPAEDPLFGKTFGKARLVGGKQSNGKARPDLEIQTQVNDESISKFLRGEIGIDLEPCEGFLVEKAQGEHPGVDGQEGLWTHLVLRDEHSKWLAEQVWGFEIINNERRYSRRMVASDLKGNVQLGHLVYSFKN